ncbi:MAG: fluoride efflux transporter CrcB [Sphingomonadaceae bacterium]
MPVFTSCLLVALGGAAGSLLRFAVSRLLAFTALPWGTFAVNIAGGLAIGIIAGTLTVRGGEGWRLFLVVGLLGGFTTFSAFSLELAVMLGRGALLTALLYAAGSVLLALAATFTGLWLARSVV